MYLHSSANIITGKVPIQVYLLCILNYTLTVFSSILAILCGYACGVCSFLLVIWFLYLRVRLVSHGQTLLLHRGIIANDISIL